MIVVHNSSIVKIYDFEMRLSEFPKGLRSGIGDGVVLESTEKSARNLINSRFGIHESLQFLKDVCRWGGDNRIPQRIRKYNSDIEISSSLRESYEATERDDIISSFDRITSLKQLKVSFGTKHLKFLGPDKHVVLDRIIESKLGFARNEIGYMAWRGVCLQILDIVRDNKIACPRIGQSGWRVADIEMAIFNRIRDV